MTVLYDDRGLKLDNTKEFLEKYENIGVLFSSGADSTFLIYWLARCIDELNLYDTHTILPIHAIDVSWPIDTVEYVRPILEMIRGFFPKVTIFDQYNLPFESTTTPDFPTPKTVYYRPVRDRLEEGFCDITITGSTSAPLFEDIFLGYITVHRTPEIKKNQIHEGLFITVDKKFLAYQYRKFDLMDNLYPLTKSCQWRGYSRKPCTGCFWCQEKYWAFGSYDGGVK